MITILHNPSCSKSRQGLKILKESGCNFKTKLYLKDPLTAKELIDILGKLQIKAIDLVRTGETIWKEQYKGKDLSEGEIVKAMIKHPKLIQRPVVFDKNKGIIGRPPENIKSIL